MTDQSSLGGLAAGAAKQKAVRGRRAWAALLLCAVSLGSDWGQSVPAGYPSGPVKIVVPFGPGSGSDIATVAVALAQADGLTLLLGTNGTHGVNPGLVAKLGYDPIEDFAPIGLIVTFSSFLVVHPSVPARTLAELLAYITANPKSVTFAAGITSSMVMGEMFARRAGAEMLRVLYQSNPLGLTDVIAGRVQVMFPDISSRMVHVKFGAARALCVERWSA